MNNVIRKAVRVIIDQLGELQNACKNSSERMLIQDARISLVRADYYDFHVNPKKKYVEPKSSFKYKYETH